jgi:hypothetical protein
VKGSFESSHKSDSNYDYAPTMSYSKCGSQGPQNCFGKNDDEMIEVEVERSKMDLRKELILSCRKLTIK